MTLNSMMKVFQAFIMLHIRNDSFADILWLRLHMKIDGATESVDPNGQFSIRITFQILFFSYTRR